MAKKPTLADFQQHCCDCTFCHPLRIDAKRVGCYVNPPEFLYGDEDDMHYAECYETSLTRNICRLFVSKAQVVN